MLIHKTSERHPSGRIGFDRENAGHGGSLRHETERNFRARRIPGISFKFVSRMSRDGARVSHKGEHSLGRWATSAWYQPSRTTFMIRDRVRSPFRTMSELHDLQLV